MNKIFEEIRKERERQDEKWGIQSHHPIVWDSILSEEAGEVSKAALESYFDGYPDTTLDDYRKELIQTAAVAVAAIQCLDEGYADSHSTELDLSTEKPKWKVLGKNGNWLEAETGILYEVITDEGNTYQGHAMDWGFVPSDAPSNEITIEDNGEQIIFFRKINNG